MLRVATCGRAHSHPETSSLRGVGAVVCADRDLLQQALRLCQLSAWKAGSRVSQRMTAFERDDESERVSES